MMFTCSAATLALLAFTPAGTSGHEAIERAVLDYAESYYEVKPEYVERSIHKSLAKIGYTWKGGNWVTRPMDYDGFRKMVQNLQDHDHTPEPGPKEVVILDAMDQTALVQLTGSWGIDYMHLARFDGQWQTRHVVWQSAPAERPAEAIEEDRAAVERAARNYLDALYEVKPELMDKSLHADLVKFGFWRGDPAQDYQPMPMTLEQLKALAAKWNAGGDKVTDDTPGDVQVLGVMDRVACVKLTAAWGVDYMNLVKGEDGTWRILHVMWQSLPAESPGG